MLCNGCQRFGYVPALSLMLWACMVSPAHGQFYCARIAELVDSPANVRSLPSRSSAIRCQLRPIGLRFRIFPILPGSFARQYDWLATLACHGPNADARIGLGVRPDYIHRSQLRVVGIDALDWPPERSTSSSPSPAKTCQNVWQPYE